MNEQPVVALTKREALKLRRRIKARIEYQTRKEHVRARNLRSLLKKKAQDPEGFKARAKEYNKRYFFKNPEARRQTLKKYREANRELCNQRTIQSQARRKRSCRMYRLRCSLSTSLWIRLNECRLKKAQGVKYGTLEAFKWLEWLRERGYGDWTTSGMEVDHVVPMARWNLQYPQAQEAVNGWQNLFPLPMHENRVKNKRILPEYIRRVWRLREEYLNERRR